MFGLLKSFPSIIDNDTNISRQHYCGVCKAIGVQYGHMWRWSVSGEAVFLADLLYVLQRRHGKDIHFPERIIGHCLSLAHMDELPNYVMYAGTVSALSGLVTLQDKIEDEEIPLAKLAQKITHPTLKRMLSNIYENLVEQEFPIDQFEYWHSQQRKIEDKGIDQLELREAIKPVAMLMGTAYATGAELINAHEEKPNLFQLGYWIGWMLMLVDAIEDFENDNQKGRWNPLIASNKTKEEGILVLDEIMGKARAVLLDILPDEESTGFIIRLEHSISQKLFTGCSSRCNYNSGNWNGAPAFLTVMPTFAFLDSQLGCCCGENKSCCRAPNCDAMTQYIITTFTDFHNFIHNFLLHPIQWFIGLSTAIGWPVWQTCCCTCLAGCCISAYCDGAFDEPPPPPPPPPTYDFR